MENGILLLFTFQRRFLLVVVMKHLVHHRFRSEAFIHTTWHTRLTAPCPGLPAWAGTRKVKPICILLKQETVSGSGISCTSLQTGNHASTPPLSSYRPDALPAAQPTASKHWRHVQYNRSKIASTRCWATQKLLTQSCNWRADHFQNLSTLLWSIACLIYSSLFTKLVATISISGNLLIIFWVILLRNKQTVILIIIRIPSPTHSFIPGLKLSFSANPSHRNFFFSSSGFTTWIPQTVYCYFWAYSVFYFLVSVLHFLVVVSVR